MERGYLFNGPGSSTRAKQTQEDRDPITTSKLRCGAGLRHLEAKQYMFAAFEFLEVHPDLGNNFDQVLSAKDIALCGGLCALATFDRLELKRKVIDSINFQCYLEQAPEVMVLIKDFYSSRYASCFEHLENLKPKLLSHYWLHDHVVTLYDWIRRKALVQYTRPYVSIDMHIMAEAFRTDITSLERELVALIAENHIQARIDLHKKILYAWHEDQRSETFQQVLETGAEFERDVRATLLNANLLKHEYNPRAQRKP